MSKLNIWKEDWNQAERNWEATSKKAEAEQPNRKLTVLPNMVGITPETAKNLKWKSLKWMILKDKGLKILKGFLKHPLKYGVSLVKSTFKAKPYVRKGDLFLYGLRSIDEFKEQLKSPQTLLVLGFSYCHKPFECPSGRFSDQCCHDFNHPVCQQCFIGKAVSASEASSGTIPLFIPTIHYIGAKIFEIVHANPDKKIIFIITACELTLEMFGDWGNMVGIQGVGIRLDGRICNTMKAFELSENGIKPGLTVVLPDTQRAIMEMIRVRLER